MSNFSEDYFSFPAQERKFQKDYQILLKASNNGNKTNKDILDVPKHGSQDFCLQLSNDSIPEDSEDCLTNNVGKSADNNDIIIISDSGSDYHSDNYCNKKATTPVISGNNCLNSVRSKQYTLEISDSSDEDEKFYQAWRNRNKYTTKLYNTDKSTSKKNNSFYTSDDSLKSSILLSSDDNKNTNISKDTHISSSLPTVPHKDERCDIQIQNDILEQKRNTQMSTPTLNIKLLGKSNSDNNNSGTNSNKPKTFVQITRGDINKMLKNINSTKAVYESPKIKESNIIIDESISEGHPAFLTNNTLMKRSKKQATTIIDETASNPEILENQSSEVNVLTTFKVDNKSHDAAIDNQMKDLSERKRQEISDWLMTNSPGSQSDSSFTNIAPSNRHSRSSGNSSLERFEMNYETPNNRGKIRNSKPNEKSTNLLDVNKKINNIVSKHKRVNELLHRTNNSVPRSCDNVQKKKSTDQHKNVVTDESSNMNVMECADILDKLYGNVWRDKADVLLSTPTDKRNIITKDRAVQTERKAIIRSKHLIKTGETQYESNRNTKPQAKSTTKKKTKYRIQRNSFINDMSSSDSEKESLYYTALTTPRTSNITPRNPTPSTLQRVVEICDSETEDDEYNTNHRPEIEKALDRKRLSFSDNECGSSTSEFDPGDDIPQKRVHKKDISKIKKVLTTPKNKYPVISVQNKEREKHKSFLASLSDSIPISIAHPDAKKYRLTYKNNKEELCKHLYKLYNEKVFDKKLPEDMLIEWNVRMRGTAGYCYNKKSVIALGRIRRSSRIVLATKILDTPDRLRDTLIHEMCHAAAWLINDVSDGHGPVWTGWANRAMKVFPELPTIRRCHDYEIKTKFTYRCISCGYSIGRHSKSLDIERKRCGHCYGKFELLINKKTKSGTVQMQTPKREPSGFALYVKDNYSSVKKERNLKHGEVMKILGQQFSAVKIGKKDDNNIDNKKDSSN